MFDKIQWSCHQDQLLSFFFHLEKGSFDLLLKLFSHLIILFTGHILIQGPSQKHHHP
jgi:hypothetical protein